METVVVVIAILNALFVALFLPLVWSSTGWKEEQERARARRMAEARMEARLLRFNI
ncbi:MAG: hypothetical protein J0L64_20680 [Acidobacteria bacterium]|nr:hypothetical protein [Acidobacteriota bacterium]